ncbi:Retrovirus-related Pol polyprotein from transposon TNT 1-94 [Sesamum angolense]|uniref:Retrovirus-related Pol polyprotein from transposon TNT 1-94 n=1 Tax=Sesamum angolense TaxID=2727404 RepID=A0AAE1WEU5_9LAMI|nr:Retrovirus-related Pol polyprotein from transposon TNT 1-94 [Sesamum angolense]
MNATAAVEMLSSPLLQLHTLHSSTSSSSPQISFRLSFSFRNLDSRRVSDYRQIVGGRSPATPIRSISSATMGFELKPQEARVPPAIPAPAPPISKAISLDVISFFTPFFHAWDIMGLIPRNGRIIVIIIPVKSEMAISMTRTLPDLSKMEPLDGTNFKRWSQKLLIFFEQLEVDYVLFTDPPEITTQTMDTSTAIVTTSQTDSSRREDELKAKYEKDNKTVRGHLLNYMTNTLFDLFVNHKSARTIWNTLESRYGSDDAWRKKYVVGKWLQFQIVDGKSIMDQVHEFQRKGQKFKKNVQLKSHKGNDEKIQKNKCQCYCCGKTGHKAYQCYQRKDQQKTNQKQNPQLNLAETEEIIAAVVVEANLVENKVDWILDTGASKHFCANKELFHEFHEASDGECVFMGNSATAGVMGKGKVLLKLTSGKILALLDVLYVPSLRRNLISGSLLNKVGLKIVLESDKFDMKDLGEADVILGVLEAFCDANWVTDNDEVSSTSGYVFTLGGGAISWKSAKQTCIARSTMESEFIALELAGQEAEWLRNLIGDIPLWGSTAPVSLHCDSQAAIGIAKNYAYNGKRRHIRLKHSA